MNNNEKEKSISVAEILETSSKQKNFNKRKKIIIRISTFAIITLISLLSLFFTSSLESLLNFDFFANSAITKNDSKIHFIDVGEGDCTVIEFIDGKVMMIDCGPKEKWNKINTYFEFLEIPKRIDYFILTHTDKDHIGNAEKLLENYDVKNLYLPKVYSNYEVSNNLATNKNYKVYDNIVWNNFCYKARTILKPQQINYINDFISIENIGENEELDNSYSVHIFPPSKDYYEEDNDYSPIIWVKLGYHQTLLTGDAGKDSELEFINTYKTLVEDKTIFNIETLKVGHHGSKNSSSLEFLQKISPRFCVVSCGKNNSYGHPANDTINNIKQVKSSIKIYRTDINNSIMCVNSYKGGLPSLVVKYDYENFDNVYIKLYYVVLNVILIAFLLLIVPLFKEIKKFNIKQKNKV